MKYLNIKKEKKNVLYNNLGDNENENFNIN